MGEGGEDEGGEVENWASGLGVFDCLVLSQVSFKSTGDFGSRFDMIVL